PRQMHLQQLVQLLQLQLVIGDEFDPALLALDGAFAALEVEAGGDLAIDAGYRIIHFREIEPGDDVETGHGRRSSSIRAARYARHGRSAVASRYGTAPARMTDP